jgi:hypothetical protein
MSVNRIQAWVGVEEVMPVVLTAAESGAFTPAPIPMNWLGWQCQMYQWAYEQALLQVAPSLYEIAQRPSLN